MEQEVINREQKKICFFPKEVKMRIAICDKDTVFSSTLKKELYGYAEARKYDIVIECFEYGEKMLNSKDFYNIVFLGYNLAGANGLETAIKLRDTNDSSNIIFISSNMDCVLESFKVKPYRFLVRPFDIEEVYKMLDELFEEYARNRPLWIKCGEDTVCMNTDDIVYLEANNKHCYIHLEDSVLECNRTMARVSEVLPKYCFGKINRAFIINFNHVKKYNSENVYMSRGHSLHISRNYLKSFKIEYRTFINPCEP